MTQHEDLQKNGKRQTDPAAAEDKNLSHWQSQDRRSDEGSDTYGYMMIATMKNSDSSS